MRFCLCVNIKFNDIGATGTEKGGHGCGRQGTGDGV